MISPELPPCSCNPTLKPSTQGAKEMQRWMLYLYFFFGYVTEKKKAATKIYAKDHMSIRIRISYPVGKYKSIFSCYKEYDVLDL